LLVAPPAEIQPINVNVALVGHHRPHGMVTAPTTDWYTGVMISPAVRRGAGEGEDLPRDWSRGGPTSSRRAPRPWRSCCESAVLSRETVPGHAGTGEEFGFSRTFDTAGEFGLSRSAELF